MTIELSSLDEVVEAVAGLVKRGITFKAYYHKGVWIIELTGGF